MTNFVSEKNVLRGTIFLSLEEKGSDFYGKRQGASGLAESGAAYYELIKPGDTTTDDRYRQLIKLYTNYGRKNVQNTPRHDKDIFQCDNAQSHVTKCETFCFLFSKMLNATSS